jgi:hypothetical protein
MVYGIYSHALLLHDAIVSQDNAKQPNASINPRSSVASRLSLEELAGDIRSLLSNIFISTRSAVFALAKRLHGPMADLLIDIIVEELRRIKEAAWSSYYPKVSDASLRVHMIRDVLIPMVILFFSYRKYLPSACQRVCSR